VINRRQFITQSVFVCDGRRAIASKYRVWDKVPEESTLIFAGTQITFQYSVG